MSISTSLLRLVLPTLFVAALSSSGHGQAALLVESPPEEVVFVETLGDRVVFHPLIVTAGLSLSVSKPDGEVLESIFESGADPAFFLGDSGSGFPDGLYTWEVRALPAERTRVRSTEETTESAPEPAPLVQSGAFRVGGGSVLNPNVVETYGETWSPDKDQVILDDLIVDGSACIGFDCVNGESFGFDTIRLKENNLRIRFVDTSNSSSFPTNDWQLTANDSSNGGANKFSIDDIDGGRTPFTIEAGARSNALYVDDGGRVGMGTSTPVTTIHSRNGNTPTLRLEQDGTSGFMPQTWDVAGNEANFFIRDATNGSTLPFRIRPGAPSNALDIHANGRVGIGTSSPTAPIHLVRSSSSDNAAMTLEKQGGAKGLVSASLNVFTFGSTTDHVVQMIAGEGAQAGWKMKVFPDLSLQMRSGATCTVGGIWTNSSAQASQRNIRQLSTDEALQALAGLNPVRFQHKADPGEEHVGFTAEEAPDLLTTSDRVGMSPMDVAAVLTKVVQEQQRLLDEQRTLLEEQGRRIRALEKSSRLASRSQR